MQQNLPFAQAARHGLADQCGRQDLALVGGIDVGGVPLDHGLATRAGQQRACLQPRRQRQSGPLPTSDRQ